MITTPGFPTQATRLSHPLCVCFCAQPFAAVKTGRTDRAIPFADIHPPYRIWIDFFKKSKEVRALFDLEQEYERVRQEYAEKDARGIPMSVRERYERQLSELRQKLQAQQAWTQKDVEGQTGRPL